MSHLLAVVLAILAALVFGIALLILAFRLRARHEERSHPAVAPSAT